MTDLDRARNRKASVVATVLNLEAAGYAVITIVASTCDTRIPQIAERGLTPSNEAIRDNGMHETTYSDPDGNEISFGGQPVES